MGTDEEKRLSGARVSGATTIRSQHGSQPGGRHENGDEGHEASREVKHGANREVTGSTNDADANGSNDADDNESEEIIVDESDYMDGDTRAIVRIHTTKREPKPQRREGGVGAREGAGKGLQGNVGVAPPPLVEAVKPGGQISFDPSCEAGSSDGSEEVSEVTLTSSDDDESTAGGSDIEAAALLLDEMVGAEEDIDEDDLDPLVAAAQRQVRDVCDDQYVPTRAQTQTETQTGTRTGVCIAPQADGLPIGETMVDGEMMADGEAMRDGRDERDITGVLDSAHPHPSPSSSSQPGSAPLLSVSSLLLKELLMKAIVRRWRAAVMVDEASTFYALSHLVYNSIARWAQCESVMPSIILCCCKLSVMQARAYPVTPSPAFTPTVRDERDRLVGSLLHGRGSSSKNNKASFNKASFNKASFNEASANKAKASLMEASLMEASPMEAASIEEPEVCCEPVLRALENLYKCPIAWTIVGDEVLKECEMHCAPGDYAEWLKQARLQTMADRSERSFKAHMKKNATAIDQASAAGEDHPSEAVNPEGAQFTSSLLDVNSSSSATKA